MQTLHAPCERISETWELKQVGRAREQKASRFTVHIHITFDGEGEFGRTLNFVDRDLLWQLVNEALSFCG